MEKSPKISCGTYFFAALFAILPKFDMPCSERSLNPSIGLRYFYSRFQSTFNCPIYSCRLLTEISRNCPIYCRLDLNLFVSKTG